MLESINSRNQQIKEYIDEVFGQEDAILKQMRVHSLEMGLPNIQIPIHLGKLIYLLTKIQSPQKILEIGTLGGYSTVWLSRALPSGGKMISLEINSSYAQLARTHLQTAGLSHCVEVREGDALQLLPLMVDQQEGPFDLIFIDADKEYVTNYLDWAIQLGHPGTLILTDNLIPKGEEIGVPCNHESYCIYRFNRYLSSHPQLETALVLSVVGDKGRLDSLGISRLKEKLS